MNATRLQATYQGSYEPRVMPADQAMVDALREQNRTVYAAEFYSGVVTHQRPAILMIDEYRGEAVRLEVKRMAEQMRWHQLSEIQKVGKKGAA